MCVVPMAWARTARTTKPSARTTPAWTAEMTHSHVAATANVMPTTFCAWTIHALRPTVTSVTTVARTLTATQRTNSCVQMKRNAVAILRMRSKHALQTLYVFLTAGAPLAATLLQVRDRLATGFAFRKVSTARPRQASPMAFSNSLRNKSRALETVPRNAKTRAQTAPHSPMTKITCVHSSRRKSSITCSRARIRTRAPYRDCSRRRRLSRRRAMAHHGVRGTARDSCNAFSTLCLQI